MPSNNLKTDEAKTPAHTLGPVTLIVADLKRCTEFYHQTLGLTIRQSDTQHVSLGTAQQELLVLRHLPHAPPAGVTTGLYHIAFLLPSRQDLARQLLHFERSRTQLSGAADHDVSEALYLADPEGNGLEIYRDRPRDEWLYPGGHLQMGTKALHWKSLLASADSTEAFTGMPAGTRLGHLHLRVSDLASAEAFYRDVLGMDVTARYGHDASFLSYIGYHHHLGINTWESRGAPPAPLGARGLEHFSLRVATSELWDHILSRATAVNVVKQQSGDEALLHDPSGIAIRLQRLA
ncbi:MAG: VOC family protein [Phycisphaerales bacterium]|nr:VOC family protein [Phycisphaerales bacterium]